jgi:protein TonB
MLGGGVWAAREPGERALFMDLTLNDPDERADATRGSALPRGDVGPAVGSPKRATAARRASAYRPSDMPSPAPSAAAPSAVAEPAPNPIAPAPAPAAAPEIAATPSEAPPMPTPPPAVDSSPSVAPSAVAGDASPQSASTAAGASSSTAASSGRDAGGNGAAVGGVASADGLPGASAARGARDGAAVALAVPGDGGGEMYGAYLAALRRRLQETLEYPAAARRRGLTGTVHLEISLESTGRVSDVLVVRSSSHAVLDDAALRAARSLARLPFPPDVRPRPLRVRLPVVFELR